VSFSIRLIGSILDSFNTHARRTGDELRRVDLVTLYAVSLGVVF
jgi:hypothetical protein